MGLTDFTALSFDCYGTLIDWESGISAVLIPWAAAHGVSLTPEQLLERFAAAEALEEARTPAALYPDVLAATMQALGEATGVAVDAAECERLARSVPEW